MPKFRKRPVEIEAVQWTGHNLPSVEVFTDGKAWFGFTGSAARPYYALSPVNTPPESHLWIRTLEGEMRADPGDWIIKGVQGEFYLCKPSIFEATYEPVDQTPEQTPEMDRTPVCVECGARGDLYRTIVAPPHNTLWRCADGCDEKEVYEMTPEYIKNNVDGFLARRKRSES